MGTKIADTEKTGKVAIVTGGSKGIGASTVRLLVEKGHKVVIGDIAENEGLALAKELNKTSDSAFFVKCDVTKMSDVDHLMAACVEHFGVLDWLVNNAGVDLTKSTTDLTEE